MVRYTDDDEEIIETETGATDDHEFDIPNDSQAIADGDTVIASGASIMVPSATVAPDTTFTSAMLFTSGGGTCNNCKGNKKQPPRHCQAVNGMFQDTCSNRHCGCRCRTHALDKDGHLKRINFVEVGHNG